MRDRELVSELAAQPAASAGSTKADRAEEVVTHALARLAPNDREILQLLAWEGLTPAEVAVALGLRAGTARVRLHRARQALASDPAVRALVEEPEPAIRATT